MFYLKKNNSINHVILNASLVKVGKLSMLANDKSAKSIRGHCGIWNAIKRTELRIN